MIGRVNFRSRDEDVVAELADSGRWSCPARPDVAGTLNAAFAPRPGYSPSHGRFGAKQIHEAADMLGGTVEMAEVEPDPPDVVY